MQRKKQEKAAPPKERKKKTPVMKYTELITFPFSEDKSEESTRKGRAQKAVARKKSNNKCPDCGNLRKEFPHLKKE